MEALRKELREHLVLLPDLAFVSQATVAAGRSAQDAWKNHQRMVLGRVLEMEQGALESPQYPLAICQYTTLDCLRNWTGNEAAFWAEMKTTRDQQLRRYDMVIHLRPPLVRDGGTASIVRSHRAFELPWVGHPRREVVEWKAEPAQQLAQIATLVRGRLPPGT
jgi:hypothetical protein